jgi:hypothetical protein
VLEDLQRISLDMKEQQNEIRNAQNRVEESQRSFAQVTASGLENAGKITTSPVSKDTFREVMREQERETAEREERSKNIIIFGATESKKIRKDDCAIEDTRFVSGFLDAIGVGDISFAEVTRLGPKTENKCRPLRFKVDDLRKKKSIMDNLSQLKDAEPSFAEIGVRHDLTPAQRDELKKLIQEAKCGSSKSDDFLFLVRSKGPLWDPRIIKVKRRANQSRQTTQRPHQTTPGGQQTQESH